MFKGWSSALPLLTLVLGPETQDCSFTGAGHRGQGTGMALLMPPGQQGEGQGFPLGVADAQVGQGAYGQAAAAASQLVHQHAVAGATGRRHDPGGGG